MSAQPEVGDSHYVPKFLLRNWETASKNLRYFDFISGRIHKVGAKSMYVSRAPFPDHVEKWLGRVIESPAGEYVARAKKARAANVPDPPTPTSREWQALILLLITQFYRTAEAHEGPDSQFSDNHWRQRPVVRSCTCSSHAMQLAGTTHGPHQKFRSATPLCALHA